MSEEYARLKEIVLRTFKGGEGSGNFGHAGRPGMVGGSSTNKYRSIGETGGKRLSNLWGGAPRQNKENALKLIDPIPGKYTKDLVIDFVHPDANPVFYGLPKVDAVEADGFYNPSSKNIYMYANDRAPRVLAHEVGHHLYNTLDRDEITRFTSGLASNPIPSTFVNVQMLGYPPSAIIEEWFASNVADYLSLGNSRSYDKNATEIMNRVIGGKAKTRS